MTLLQIKYFQTVCKYNNITKAARIIHVSQPTISLAIKELEDEFGVNLFVRSANKIKLTDEGSFFLARVKQIMPDIELLEKQMMDFNKKKNLIKVGIPPMIGNFMFPELFKEFTIAYPDIQIEMMEFSSLHTISLVLDDSLDLALTIINGDVSDQLTVIPLLKTKLVYTTHENSPLRNKKILKVEDLANEKIILMGKGSFQNGLIHNIFSKRDLMLHIIVNSSQLSTITQLISSNSGGAFLFKEVAQMVPHAIYRPIDVDMTMNIGLIYKKNRQIFKDESSFIDFVKTYSKKFNNNDN